MATFSYNINSNSDDTTLEIVEKEFIEDNYYIFVYTERPVYTGTETLFGLPKFLKTQFETEMNKNVLDLSNYNDRGEVIYNHNDKDISYHYLLVKCVGDKFIVKALGRKSNGSPSYLVNKKEDGPIITADFVDCAIPLNGETWDPFNIDAEKYNPLRAYKEMLNQKITVNEPYYQTIQAIKLLINIKENTVASPSFDGNINQEINEFLGYKKLDFLKTQTGGKRYKKRKTKRSSKTNRRTKSSRKRHK